MKAECEPRAGRDLSRLDSVGSTGSPLSPEGFDWVRDELGEDIVALLDVAAAPTSAPRSSAASRRCPVYGGELQARALGAKVEAWTRTGGRSSARSASSCITEPMPSMPLYLWGDDRRLALPRELLLDVPRRLAPRRLDRDHRARHRDHLPAAPTRRSTAAASGWARASSTARCSRSTRSSTRSSSTCRATGTDGCMPLFVVLARRRRARRRARRARSSAASARTARRATSPTRSLAAPEIPRTLSGKILEVPVKRILMGAPGDEVASRDSLANPEALDWFAGLTADHG